MNSTSAYCLSRTEKLKQIEKPRRRKEVRKSFRIMMEFTIKEGCFLVNSTSHVYSKGLTSVTELLESLLFVFCLDNFLLVFLPIAVINASASMVLLHGHEL